MRLVEPDGVVKIDTASGAVLSIPVILNLLAGAEFS